MATETDLGLYLSSLELIHPSMLTSSARDLLCTSALAAYHARQQSSVSTEHLLVGAAQTPETVQFLQSLDIDPEKVLEAAKLVGGPVGKRAHKLPFELTSRAEVVLKSANSEAHRLSDPLVAPSHILIGLCKENGMGSGILDLMGLNAETARKGIMIQTAERLEIKTHEISYPLDETGTRILFYKHMGEFYFNVEPTDISVEEREPTPAEILRLIRKTQLIDSKEPIVCALKNYGYEQVKEELAKIRARAREVNDEAMDIRRTMINVRMNDPIPESI